MFAYGAALASRTEASPPVPAQAGYAWTGMAAQNKDIREAFGDVTAGDILTPVQMEKLKASSALQTFNGIFIKEADVDPELQEEIERKRVSKAYCLKAVECFRRAERFRKHGRHALAEPQWVRCQLLLNASLWEDPGNHQATFLLIALYLSRNDFTKAKDEAECLLRTLRSQGKSWDESHDPVLHRAVAHAAWCLQHDAEVIEYLLEASNMFPEQPALCVRLSEALLASQCHKSAEDMAQLAFIRDTNPLCRRKLSDAEQEHALLCLISALCQSGMSLADATKKQQVYRLRKLLQVEELQQRLDNLSARLENRRGVQSHVSFFPHTNDVSYLPRTKMMVSTALKQQSDTGQHRLQARGRTADTHQDDSLDSGAVFDVGEGIPESEHDAVLQKLQWHGNAASLLPDAQHLVMQDMEMSSPSMDKQSPVIAPNAAYSAKELMIGLMPLMSSDEQKHPAIEAESGGDLGCCMTPCRRLV